MNRMNRRRRARDSHPDAVWLASALRDQAHKHEADSGLIGARFEHLVAVECRPGEPRRAEPRRATDPARMRLTRVPLGILAAVTLAAVAVSLGLDSAPAAHPSSEVASAAGERSAVAAPRPSSLSASSTVLPADHALVPSANATRPAGALTAAGTVDPHSSPYWVQENLTVIATRTVRELQVTVTVSGGPTVRFAGMWTTILAADVETSTNRIPGGLEYHVILKAGQILQPASYRFGFQFGRPTSGHNFVLDAYRVVAVTADGVTDSTSGTF